jgi:hypothetical protein
LVIDGIKNSGKMKELLRLVAFQPGNEVSYHELGQQIGMSKNTVEKYLDLLAKVFVVYRLGAYPHATFDVISRDNYLQYI